MELKVFFVLVCTLSFQIPSTPLEVNVVEDLQGMTFTVTRSIDVTDGWFALGVPGYFSSGQGMMTGTLGVVCGEDTVHAYHLQAMSRPQESWREDSLISLSSVLVDGSIRQCTFSIPSVSKDMVAALVYAYGTTGCFDIEDPTCPGHNFDQQQNRAAFVVSEEDIEVHDIVGDIDALRADVDEMASAIDAITRPNYGLNNIAAEASIHATSSCGEQNNNGLDKLTDGITTYSVQGLPNPNNAYISCGEINPTVYFTFHRTVSVSHVVVYNRRGQTNRFRGIEVWIAFSGLQNPQLCGRIPNNYQGINFGAYTFSCGNKAGQIVMIKKDGRNMAFTEVEIISSMAVSELVEDGIPVVPAIAPTEHAITGPASVYVGDVLTFPETAYNCDDGSAAERMKTSTVGELLFSLEETCSSTFVVQVSEAPDDLAINAFAVASGGSGGNAVGELTEADRLVLENTASTASVNYESVEKLKDVSAQATRSILLTQFRLEQEARITGSSGIRSIRGSNSGTEPYYRAGSAASGNPLQIHNHPNNNRTMGMGEFKATMNGVTFQTRHNDYSLKKVSAEAADHYSGDRGTESITQPDVPDSVKNAGSVAEQIAEMKEYFKAFHDQDWEHRDYRDYFKPVLCYLEGNWLLDDGDLVDPFVSDRHQINAETWDEQHAQEQFLAASGKKDPAENVPFLPSKIVKVDIDEDGIPVPQMAKWTYRILCHPLSRDLPTERFVLDVAESTRARLFVNKPHWDEEKRLRSIMNSRVAKFKLHPKKENRWRATVGQNPPEKKGYKYEFLDDLMAEIPGRSGPNYFLQDNSMNSEATEFGDSSQTLNTAYYSRWYSFAEGDAMGRNTQRRGYADNNLFAAMTHHEQVPANKVCKNGECWEQRWTYAMPLEVVYLTPLANWNPYELEKFGKEEYPTMQTEGFKGKTEATPVRGFSPRGHFMTTPSSFFGENSNTDLADTGEGRYAINPNGEVNHVTASGTRITLPRITMPDGESFVTRLRYPIFPIYEENNLAFREARGMRDLIIKEQKGEISNLKDQVHALTSTLNAVLSHLDLEDMHLESFSSDVGEVVEDAGQWTQSTFPGRLELSLSPGNPDGHTHEVYIDWDYYTDLMNGETITLDSERWDEDGPHDHMHEISFKVGANGFLELVACHSCEQLDDPHQTVNGDPSYENAFTLTNA